MIVPGLAKHVFGVNLESREEDRPGQRSAHALGCPSSEIETFSPPKPRQAHPSSIRLILGGHDRPQHLAGARAVNLSAVEDQSASRRTNPQALLVLIRCPNAEQRSSSGVVRHPGTLRNAPIGLHQPDRVDVAFVKASERQAGPTKNSERWSQRSRSRLASGEARPAESRRKWKAQEAGFRKGFHLGNRGIAVFVERLGARSGERGDRLKRPNRSCRVRNNRFRKPHSPAYLMEFG
jgi:hypothetical protein